MSRTHLISRRGLLERAILGLAGTALAVACAPAAESPSTPAAGAAAPKATEAAKPAEKAPAGATAPATPAASPGTPTPEPYRAAAAGRKTTIQLYQVWGGQVFKNWVATIEDFEAKNADTAVEVVYAPFPPQKLYTAVAAGKAPDVAMVPPSFVGTWSEMGVNVPVDDYLKRDGFSRDQFYAAAWDGSLYKGQKFTMPLQVDPNFAFIWNKDLFQKNGLDPEAPPKNIQDLTALQEKLTVKEGDQVTQIGIIPWSTYGNSNSIFTWGLCFGGRFISEDNTKVTPDDAQVVKALEWMSGLAKKIGGPGAVSVAPPGMTVHPFFNGRIGAAPLVSINTVDLPKFAPNLKHGATFMPYQEPAKPNPAWVAGWHNTLANGSKNRDAGWEFIKWVGGTQDGTQAVVDRMGGVPGWKPSKGFETLRKTPALGVYLDVLETAPFYYPVIPVLSYYTTQLGQAHDDAVYGRKEPAQALKDCAEATTKEWQRFLAEKK